MVCFPKKELFSLCEFNKFRLLSLGFWRRDEVLRKRAGFQWSGNPNSEILTGSLLE